MNNKGFAWVIVVAAIIILGLLAISEDQQVSKVTNLNQNMLKDAEKLSEFEIILNKSTWDCNWNRPEAEISACISLTAPQIKETYFGSACTLGGIDINKIKNPKEASILLVCQKTLDTLQQTKYSFIKKIKIQNKPDFLDKSLKLWLRMNGKLIDISPESNSIIDINATQTIGIDGVSKTAYIFDGNKSTITISNSPDLNIPGNITIAFWVKPNPLTKTWAPVVYKGDDKINERNYTVWINTNGYIQWGYNVSNTATNINTAAGTIQFNTWQHVAVTRNTTTGNSIIYINGIARANATVAVGQSTALTNPLYLGKPGEEIDATHQNFNGIIDEVMIFGQELTANDINAIYNYTMP